MKQIENYFIDSEFVKDFLKCSTSYAYIIIRNVNKEAKQKHGFSYRPRGKTTLKDLYEYLGLSTDNII